MSVARRTLSRLAATGVTASLLVAGVAAQAQAATYPHVTLAKAKTAIPASKTLPGGVKLVGKVVTSAKASVSLCATADKDLKLLGASVVLADYGTADAIDSPKYLQYEIAIYTFGTAAETKSSVAAMAKVEKACPKSAQRPVDGVPEVITRTLTTKAASKAWTGYRTIDHITATAGTVTVSARVYETFLVRGNVVAVIDELGSITPTNAAAQDVRRKAVTNLVIKALTALK
jgi:hypothetical protein